MSDQYLSLAKARPISDMHSAALIIENFAIKVVIFSRIFSQANFVTTWSFAGCHLIYKLIVHTYNTY